MQKEEETGCSLDPEAQPLDATSGPLPADLESLGVNTLLDLCEARDIDPGPSLDLAALVARLRLDEKSVDCGEVKGAAADPPEEEGGQVEDQVKEADSPPAEGEEAGEGPDKGDKEEAEKPSPGPACPVVDLFSST